MNELNTPLRAEPDPDSHYRLNDYKLVDANGVTLARFLTKETAAAIVGIVNANSDSETMRLSKMKALMKKGMSYQEAKAALAAGGNEK